MKLIKLFLVVFLQIYAEASSETPSIIIIGAGSSGLAAARRLLENNYTNIKILEAENRIGGRIHSIFFGNAFIDMGAESCHGVKNNIVYEMVKDLNVLQHFDYPKDFYHSGRKNIDREFSDELVKMINSIYGPDGHRDEAEGKTVGQYCINKYNASIHDKFKQNPENFQMAKASLDFFHHTVLSYEGSFSWFEPSAKNDYTDCEGDLSLSWSGYGYKTALEVLIRKFPLLLNQTVLLNKEVVKVLWNESSNHILCSDGSLFSADYVIFTPSIGVLKNNHDRLFLPSLPRAKIKAIEQIGFGGVMKVAMYFKNRWWKNEKNFTGFNFIWSEKDKVEVSREFPDGPLKEGRSWLTELYTVYAFKENPNVLVGWLTGKLIPKIEIMSNETLIHGMEFVFNKFLGHKFNITGPDAIVRTSWYTNPHFGGSYSFQTPEARKSKVTAEIELSKPVLNKEGRPVLLFAGEATHPYFYSTVHGAIETGFREADRIINRYK